MDSTLVAHACKLPTLLEILASRYQKKKKKKKKHKATMKAWKGKGTKPTQKDLCLSSNMGKPIHPFPGARKVVTAVLEPVENSEDMTDNEEDEDASDSGGERSDSFRRCLTTKGASTLGVDADNEQVY
jgi:hypothetical protein